VKIDVEDSGKVNVSSNDQESAAKALQIIGDLTPLLTVGRPILERFRGWRISERSSKSCPYRRFCWHISEVPSTASRMFAMKLKEGDQVLVKVLAVEGNPSAYRAKPS